MLRVNHESKQARLSRHDNPHIDIYDRDERALRYASRALSTDKQPSLLTRIVYKLFALKPIEIRVPAGSTVNVRGTIVTFSR